MITIWKYPLAATQENKFAVPAGAKLLCAQSQHDWPNAWFEVEDSNPKEERTLYMFGTGHKIDVPLDTIRYVDTLQIQGGQLVFHVYEKIK